MTNVYIDSRRDGYSPSQCHGTMTVGELIDILSQYDEDQPVYIRNDNGYTYGSVQMDSVTEGEEDEDERDFLLSTHRMAAVQRLRRPTAPRWTLWTM